MTEDQFRHLKSFDEVKKDDLDNKIGVYIIRDPVTGKEYVGSSVNVYDRLKSHVSRLRQNSNSNKNLQEVFNNQSSLEVLVALTDTRESSFELEQKLITRNFEENKSLNISNNARNTALGFVHPSGHKLSKEHCEKISKGNLGKPKSQQHKAALTEVRRSNGRQVSIAGVVYRSCGDAADALGIKYDDVYNRCSKDLKSYTDWFFLS